MMVYLLRPSTFNGNITTVTIETKYDCFTCSSAILNIEVIRHIIVDYKISSSSYTIFVGVCVVLHA